MLKRLQIRNFQAHERFRIEFDPKITAIVGPTDSGKSSILRAIRWIVTNRPRGDGFVRDGTDECWSRIKIDDRYIGRKRGKENVYRIDKKTLKAFGSDVPEEVTNILNLGEVNFQGQHDPPFWFSLTAGEVARQLNQIVDLSLMDTLQGSLAHRLRASVARGGIIEDRLTEAKRSESELSWVPSMVDSLGRLERMETAKDHTAGQIRSLRDSLGKARSYQRTIGMLRGVVSAGQEAMQKGRDARKASKHVTTLTELLGEISHLEGVVEKPVPDISSLSGMQVKLDGEGEDFWKLNTMIEKMRRAGTERQKTKDRLEDATRVLEEETEGLCPVCGKEM